MRELDLSFVIGSAINNAELLEVVDVVIVIDWMDLSVGQARRGPHIQDA